jgi:hypothetical protein
MATGRKDGSATGKRCTVNRKAGQCYQEKVDREQKGRTVLPGKDRKATRRKDSVTAKRWKGNRKKGIVTGISKKGTGKR